MLTKYGKQINRHCEQIHRPMALIVPHGAVKNTIHLTAPCGAKSATGPRPDHSQKSLISSQSQGLLFLKVAEK